NRTWRQPPALADAAAAAYLSRHGVMQTPRQTAIVQVLRHSHREERADGRTKAAIDICSAIRRAANVDGSAAAPEAAVDERPFGAAARQSLRKQLWRRAAAAERDSRAACEP